MNGKMKGLIITAIIMILLGVLVNPIFPVGFGGILLLIVWNSIDAYGGNPYKKRLMLQRKSVFTKSYYRSAGSDEIAGDRKYGVNPTVFVFSLGIMEIFIGFIVALSDIVIF